MEPSFIETIAIVTRLVPLWFSGVTEIPQWRGRPAVRTFRRLRHCLLQLCESALHICCLDGAELHAQKGRQARSDSRMNLASVNIRDQPGDGVPHRQRVVQGWQRNG